MAEQAKRQFGKIPPEAWLGPVSVKNYSYRAEAHAAAKSLERGGEHPSVTKSDPVFKEWEAYFRIHLGGYPYSFRMLMDGSSQSFTTPEFKPEWFDPTWNPAQAVG